MAPRHDQLDRPTLDGLHAMEQRSGPMGQHRLLAGMQLGDPTAPTEGVGVSGESEHARSEPEPAAPCDPRTDLRGRHPQFQDLRPRHDTELGGCQLFDRSVDVGECHHVTSVASRRPMRSGSRDPQIAPVGEPGDFTTLRRARFTQKVRRQQIRRTAAEPGDVSTLRRAGLTQKLSQ